MTERPVAAGPMEVVIRPFQREDMDPLYFLDQRCAPPGERLAYGRLITALLERDVLAVVAAEAMEERPQPLLGSLIVRGEPARGALSVLVLMVDPEYRRLGLARRLVDWAVRLAGGLGLREIAAVEEGAGTGTPAFLEALSFRRTEEVAPGFRLAEPRPRWVRALDEPEGGASKGGAGGSKDGGSKDGGPKDGGSKNGGSGDGGSGGDSAQGGGSDPGRPGGGRPSGGGPSGGGPSGDWGAP